MVRSPHPPTQSRAALVKGPAVLLRRLPPRVAVFPPVPPCSGRLSGRTEVAFITQPAAGKFQPAARVQPSSMLIASLSGGPPWPAVTSAGGTQSLGSRAANNHLMKMG